MKLKQKKNTNYLRWKINYNIYTSIGTLLEAINQGTTLTEMPTPGNLKSGDSLFCITTPYPHFNDQPPPPPPPPPPNFNPPPPPPPPRRCPNKLTTLYEFFHELQTFIIRFYDCEGEIIFVSDEKRAKRLQKPNYESEKIGILRKNGKNSKWKHREAHNSILSGRVGIYALKQSVKY